MSGVANSLRESATNSLQKAAEKVGLNRPAPSDDNESQASQTSAASRATDQLEELSEYCPKLTYQQRVTGFFFSFGLGYLITFLSFGFFVKLVEGNPFPFVFVYSVGNICSLLAATFLCGPKLQFKRMFHETRKWTTIIYLSTLVVTFILAFVPGIKDVVRLVLMVILLFVQFCASSWYSLSYLPFARRAVLNFLNNLA